ncbi:MAG: 50S ribosomal protein L25 [Candidatus Moranbacteria bacterium]|nr:50S ribosomal protein L25 [Candidatus Moranbacteria bacterium]
MTQNGKATVLKAKLRDKKDKVKALRDKGNTPAVIYGPKLKNSLNLVFDKKSAQLIQEKSHQASVLNLNIEGEDKDRNVIIQDLQLGKINHDLIHIDLYEVDMTKKVETEVPISFVGNCEAVKNLNAVLIKSLEEISVKCLPKDLPDHIVVNLEVLKAFDDIIYIKDLDIPEGVEVLSSDEDVVAMVQEPRSEKELEELEEEISEDVSQVEGVKDEDKEAEGKESKDEKDSKTESKEEKQEKRD